MKQTALLLLLLLQQVSLCTGLFRGSSSSRWQNEDEEEAAAIAEERDLLNTRIVGGSAVNDASKYTYFTEWHGQFCGGTLIWDDLVLTAAHCNDESRNANSVYVGTVRRRQGGVRRTIMDKVAHPDFDTSNVRNYDFMILKLDSSALVDENGQKTGVEPIALNYDRFVPAEGDPLLAVGYGTTQEGDKGMSSELRDVQIEAFSEDTCRRQYSSYFQEDIMFCAGVEGGGKDTCQGDSGGPIIDRNTNTLVGIISFGIGCGRPDYVGMNSRVSYAAGWIEGLKCDISDYPPSSCGQPTPPPPTPSPTEDPGIPGSIEVYFRTDDYPEEVSWTIIDTQTEPPWPLVFVPYNDMEYRNVKYQRVFGNMSPGRYVMRVSDKAGDGLCCSYGSGGFGIYDSNSAQEVYTNDGQFGHYYELDINIGLDGVATVELSDSHWYRPGSWSRFENMAWMPDDKSDTSWPGEVPLADTNAVVVNIKTDQYPEETSFTLESLTSGGAVEIDSWSNTNGQNAGMEELVSFEYSNLSNGWYRLEIRDSANDGVCCGYGRGWISLTGPMLSLQGNSGVVWASKGEFWGSDEIFFRIVGGGHIAHISWTTPDDGAIATSRNGTDPTD